MANPFKGEVAIEVDGQSHKLSYSVNAIIELEEALGKPLEEIVAMMNGAPRLRDMRVMFWAALIDHQPGVTLEDAKRILSRMSPNEMGEAIGRALTHSLPASEDGGASDRPPMPDQAGTGPAS